MEKILKNVKTGGKFGIGAFGLLIIVSLSSGEGCSDILDRLDFDLSVGDPKEIEDAGVK